MSGFTSESSALLLGASIGGMGTLIASLANLISYKYYIRYDASSCYKKSFYRINMVGLCLFLGVFISLSIL
jgi:Na+/H+ antiporter NhaD/arsenite permease-like protein